MTRQSGPFRQLADQFLKEAEAELIDRPVTAALANDFTDSSGFGEGEDLDGKALGAELDAAISESGLAVSGPNCLGNLAAPYNLMTITDERIERLARGPVAIFGQSGGIVTVIYVRCSIAECSQDTRSPSATKED